MITDQHHNGQNPNRVHKWEGTGKALGSGIRGPKKSARAGRLRQVLGLRNWKHKERAVMNNHTLSINLLCSLIFTLCGALSHKTRENRVPPKSLLFLFQDLFIYLKGKITLQMTTTAGSGQG